MPSVRERRYCAAEQSFGCGRNRLALSSLSSSRMNTVSQGSSEATTKLGFAASVGNTLSANRTKCGLPVFFRWMTSVAILFFANVPRPTARVEARSRHHSTVDL